MNNFADIAPAIAACSSAVIAGYIVRKIRNLIQRFRLAGATSEATSVALQSLGMTPSFILGRLVSRGVVVSTSQGRYYLDPEKEKKYYRDRKHKALIAFGFVLLAVILFALFYR